MHQAPGTGDLSGQVDKNARRLLVTDYTVKVLILFSCFALCRFVAVIHEDEPVVNQSIVQEVIEASQRSFSQELCKFIFL